ncbi:MAG TPA: tRNA (guanosine(37)-N1)-methyltransferase TrmD [Chloroflexi bacterium]|nr:tRNA (guanosine(37)-N1)-methyltransferase TrmD [Chloroflexota bacterium]
MKFDIFTLFPQIFDGVFEHSIIKRARDAGLIDIALHHIRNHARDKHKMTDDAPYGGGGGMVMKPDPIFYAVESALDYEVPASGYTVNPEAGHPPIILLSPQGRVFTQAVAQELSQYPRLMFICGRYEGVDERVAQYLATDQISIGDYVLSGGEIAAMVIVDAVTRLLPNALGDPNAAANDSHATGLLEYPHYTRPAEFKGHRVPDILLSGDHAKVSRWRREQSLKRTLAARPDLLENAPLTEEEKKAIQRLIM